MKITIKKGDILAVLSKIQGLTSRKKQPGHNRKCPADNNGSGYYADGNRP